MKSFLRCIALSLLLLAPIAASAQAPTVSAISDLSLNAGTTRNVNVVAVSAGIPITLTASLPAFATLNGPTTGTGLVSTTISLAPAAGAEGTYNASVTATSGALSSTETFLITVNAAGSNQAPTVTAPANQDATVGTLLSFNVTAADADAEAITSLSPASLPSGATFTPDGTNTSGTFSWTPTSGQTGNFDVVFTAANALSGSATTHPRPGGDQLRARPDRSVQPHGDRGQRAHVHRHRDRRGRGSRGPLGDRSSERRQRGRSGEQHAQLRLDAEHRPGGDLHGHVPRG